MDPEDSHVQSFIGNTYLGPPVDLVVLEVPPARMWAISWATLLVLRVGLNKVPQKDAVIAAKTSSRVMKNITTRYRPEVTRENENISPRTADVTH